MKGQCQYRLNIWPNPSSTAEGRTEKGQT